MSVALRDRPTIAVSLQQDVSSVLELTLSSADTSDHSHVTCPASSLSLGYKLWTAYYDYPAHDNDHRRTLRCEYRRVKADGTFYEEGAASYCHYKTDTGDFQPSDGPMSPAQRTFETSSCPRKSDHSATE